MTIQLLLLAIVVLLLACIGMLVALLRRPGQGDTRSLETRLALVGEGQERAERAVREEIARSREEAGHAGHLLRAEVGATLKGVGDTVVRTMGEMASTQRLQLDGVAARVGTLTTSN